MPGSTILRFDRPSNKNIESTGMKFLRDFKKYNNEKRKITSIETIK